MAPNGGVNIKWMTAVSVWLFLAMTTCLVTSKVSLLWILRLYKYEQIHPSTWYVMMTILLEAPLLLHVLHIVWNTPFINGPRSPMPKKSLVLLGVLGSVMESVAGAVFATEISYVLPEPALLLLPAAVFTVHLVVNTSNQLKDTSPIKATSSSDKSSAGRSSCQKFLCLLMSSYLLWAPAAVASVLHVWSSFNMSLAASCLLPLVVLVLSTTWAPHLQAAVVRATGTGGSQKNATLSLVYTLFRVATIPLTVYVIMFFKIDAFRHDVTGFLRHAAHDVMDARVWLPVLLTSLFGLGSVLVGGVAAKVALFTPGLRLPAMLTPFLTLGSAAVLWGDFESEAFWELSGSDVVTWTASAVALLAWLLPFLSPLPLIATPATLLRPFSHNFHAFTWRPFFLEQHLMLNTKQSDDSDGDGGGDSGSSGNAGRSGTKRVFVCTTMYRETESEMRRYMSSLRRTLTCDALHDVTIEVHIFLDNCVEADLHVNTYARQLLSLLTAVLSVPTSALTTQQTPYGAQVSCRVLGGHLLFVHCKDGREFKAKKRWSQVMYMNYILNHRALLHTAELSETKGDDSYRTGQDETAQNGKVWYSTKDLLPVAASQALQRMFRDNPALLNALPVQEGAAEKLPTRANRSHYDAKLQPIVGRDQCDESSSESALGSETWRETCTVSMETTSCDCSDTDDEVFSFRSKGNPRNITTGNNSPRNIITTGNTRNVNNGNSRKSRTCVGKEVGGRSFEESGGKRAPRSKGFSSRASDNSSDSDNQVKAKVNQTPLCDLQDAGKGNSRNDVHDSDFWTTFGSHAEDPSSNSLTTDLTSPDRSRTVSDDVYILATDADTEFSGASVRTLLDQCEADRSLGAVCGRTVPVGGLKPIVWYQKFEYAKDFWLVKSSQNVIGSVTCCPGCFSMYRGSALRDVMDTFSRPSASAYDTLVKDHGEDRWLCTLLMKQGWKLEYADTCHNSTHCPETCGEFLRQRRRWVLSELSNMMLIFQGLRGLVRGNHTFSSLFILSLLHMFVWVLLSPSTTLVVTCAGFHILFGVPMLYSAPAAFLVLLAFFTICVTQPRHTQRMVTQAIAAFMAAIMVAISAGFVDYVVDTLGRDVAAGYVEFKPYFLVLVLIGGTMYAALLHANEGLTLLYGLVYAAIFPAMFLALPVYSIANMVDTSWGTRELTGSRACCDVMLDDAEDNAEDELNQFKFKTSELPALSSGGREGEEEQRFWTGLKATLLGCHVNRGESDRELKRGLYRLRNRCVALLLAGNTLWYAALTSVYVLVSSDVVCYAIASLFSFSLALQLVGMTSYKLDQFLKRYIVRNMLSGGQSFWVKDKSSS